MYTGIYNGFTDLDNGLLSLLTNYIGLKISQLRENFRSREKDKNLMKVLNSISSLLECRTYMKLLVDIKEIFPQLIGYEYGRVYLYEAESIIIINTS